MTARIVGPAGAQGAMAAELGDRAPVAAANLWDLRALVREELAHVLAERPPALIDQRALARELGVSERTIYTLRGEGLPTIMVGDSPRFELALVLDWLKSRP